MRTKTIIITYPDPTPTLADYFFCALGFLLLLGLLF